MASHLYCHNISDLPLTLIPFQVLHAVGLTDDTQCVPSCCSLCPRPRLRLTPNGPFPPAPHTNFCENFRIKNGKEAALTLWGALRPGHLSYIARLRVWLSVRCKMIFSLRITGIWFLTCQPHPAACSVNTRSPVVCRDFDPTWGATDGSQDVALGWTMKKCMADRKMRIMRETNKSTRQHGICVNKRLPQAIACL